MIGARIHRTGGPDVLELEEVDEPEPGPGEILVRVRATSVNHRDIWIRKGHPHPKYRVKMPAILGIDLCGDVVATGKGVDGFAVGGRVTVSPYLSCGLCEYCRRNRPQYCLDFDVYHGTYAEYAVVPASLALNVSKDVPEEALACFSNSYITAWQMLVAKCRVGPDDVVFVWGGTSGLGSAAVEIALLSGARVIASAGSNEKLAVLAARGPELVVNHYEPDIVARVLERTNGRGASIVVEHVGQATWGRSIELCGSGATIVTAGATSGDDATVNVTAMFVKQIRIVGSRLGTMDDAIAAVRHLETGRFKPLIGAVVPLSEIKEAHRLVESGNVIGKVVVKP
jgi:NADPH:quinone reductase-like Zn-dependent oxidoreductase